MGCASSAPLVETGRNFVESVKGGANDTLSKGEKVIQETTETVKDGISSGMETVKDSVHIALNAAEETVENVTSKIGDTLNFSKTTTTTATENVKNTLSSLKDDANEAVSEAETVLASEAEHAREAFHVGAPSFFDTVQSLDDDMDNALRNVETFEAETMEKLKGKVAETKDDVKEMLDSGQQMALDVEKDMTSALGENVANIEKVTEELHEELQSLQQHKSDSTKEEENRVIKEVEPTPTFWEAAADAILMGKVVKTLEPPHENDRIFYPSNCTKSRWEGASEKIPQQENNDMNILNKEIID